MAENDVPPDGDEPTRKLHITGQADSTVVEGALAVEMGYLRLVERAAFLLIVIGAVLSVAGATGAVDWTLNIAGVNSRLTNAAPGVVCVVAGVLLLTFARPNIRIEAGSQSKSQRSSKTNP